MKNKISLAITTYNRPEMTIECFEKIYRHPRVSEIVIVDDFSTSENFEKLATIIENDYPNVWLKINQQNLGMMKNKIEAIRFSDEEFVLIADSDNRFTSDYLSALPKKLSADTIYMPEFAEPEFDFREFAGLTIDKSNINKYIDEPMFQVMLNACNYVVPRENFLVCFSDNPEIKESDTIWLNYNWFKDGYKMYVVPGMRYYHRVHSGSDWLKNAEYNMQKGQEIIELIKKL